MTAPNPGGAAGPALGLLAFALYAGHDVLVKLLGLRFSVVQIVVFAALFGFPLLMGVLIRDREPVSLRPRNPGWVALRSFGVVASAALGFYAFTVIPFAQAYAMFFTTPLLITLLAVPLLGERVGLRRMLAVVAGLAGVLIVLRPGWVAVAPGHLAALAAAFCSALVGVASRRIGRDERLAVLLMWPLLATVAVMGAALPFVYVPMALGELAMMAAIAVLSFAAMMALIGAYRRAEAALVAPMQYSQMLWAVVYGAVVFAEWPDGWTLAGAAVIVASGLYIVLRESRARGSARPVQRSAQRPSAAAPPAGQAPVCPLQSPCHAANQPLRSECSSVW